MWRQRDVLAVGAELNKRFSGTIFCWTKVSRHFIAGLGPNLELDGTCKSSAPLNSSGFHRFFLDLSLNPRPEEINDSWANWLKGAWFYQLGQKQIWMDDAARHSCCCGFQELLSLSWNVWGYQIEKSEKVQDIEV